MVKDITFHYTQEEMVKELIPLIPLTEGDTVLDAGSGKNKVFFNNIPTFCHSFECELEEGIDFLEEKNKYDWIIGNPPYHIGKDFLKKASEIANKGIAFLINLNCLNSFLLPSRLKDLISKGFYLNHIHVTQDKRWFGRYFFVIFSKDESSFLSFSEKVF